MKIESKYAFLAAVLVGGFVFGLLWRVSFPAEDDRSEDDRSRVPDGARDHPDAREDAGGCRCPDAVAVWMRDPGDWPATAFANIDICGNTHALNVDLYAEHAADGVEVTARARMNGEVSTDAGAVFAEVFGGFHAPRASGTTSRRALDEELDLFATGSSASLFWVLAEREQVCMLRYHVASMNYRP